MKKPLVSVIVTTKNSQNTIENCLLSIKNQTFREVEIVVVDNRSTDKTKKICKQFTPNVFDQGPERSAQKNYGSKKSRGEYLLFLDSDMSLNKKTIEECVKGSKNQSTVALYIPEIVIGIGFWPKVRNFERSFYDATVIDAVRFIKKEAFLSVGGFDESLWAAEDWDLTKKLKRKGKVGFINSPLYHDENNFSFKHYLSKKKYYTKGLEIYIAKWGRNDEDVKKQIGFFYRFFGVFIEDGKWKKLLAHPCLTVAMFFLRVLVGFTYAKTKKENNFTSRSQLQR